MTKLKLPPPNRLAAYLTALAALLAALAPVVVELDLKDTAGVIAGLVAIVAVFREWLKGWRAHEFEESKIARAYDHGPWALDAARAGNEHLDPGDAYGQIQFLVEIPDVALLPGGTSIPKRWVPLKDLPKVPVDARTESAP